MHGPVPSPTPMVGQGTMGLGIFRSKSKSKVYSQAVPSLAQAFSPGVIVTSAVKSPSPSTQSTTGRNSIFGAPVPPPVIVGQGMTGLGIFRSKSKSKVKAQGAPPSLAHSFSSGVTVTSTLKSPSPSTQSTTGRNSIVGAPVPPAVIAGQGMTGSGIVRSKSKSKV